MNRIRHDAENGDSLIEIIVAIVIIGALVGALLASYATASLGTKAQRDLVTADAVLRDYAELTKAAVLRECTSPLSKYTVRFSAPSGFTLVPTPGMPTPGMPTDCPGSAETVPVVVQMPNGRQRDMTIGVRIP